MGGVRLAVLIVIFFFAFHLGLYAQRNDVQVMDTTKALGSFLVEGKSFTVTLHRHAFTPGEVAANSDCGRDTVISMEIRDVSGAVQAARSFGFTPPSGNDCLSLDVSVAVLNGSRHAGLLVLYNETTSPYGVTPYTDALFQLYGVVGDRLRAFNPPILVNYDREDDSSAHDQTDDLRRIAPLDSFSDIWTLPVWAEHFNVLYPIRLDWSAGKMEPLNECSRQHSRAFCGYAVEPVKLLDPHFDATGIVHLCASRSEPCPIEIRMNVARERRIRILSGFANILWPETNGGIDRGRLGVPYDEGQDQVWLKLQVNGSEGWIHEVKDYNELGFPSEQ